MTWILLFFAICIVLAFPPARPFALLLLVLYFAFEHSLGFLIAVCLVCLVVAAVHMSRGITTFIDARQKKTHLAKKLLMGYPDSD